MRVRALVLLALVPWLAACEEPSPPKGIELPRVGTLGRAPKAPHAIVVHVTADGAITIDGKGPLGLRGLHAELVARTADPAWRERDRSSRYYLLVQADASLPWVVSQWILQVAADPRVMIYRVFFGARPREGNAAGAIGWHLPKDRGIQVLPAGPPKQVSALAVKLLARPGQRRSNPEALFAEIERTVGTHDAVEEIHFEIKTPPPHGQAVPTGYVLQVVDVLARAGVKHLTFEGAPAPVLRPGPGGSAPAVDAAFLRKTVARLKELEATPFVRVGGRVLGEPADDEPVPPAAGLQPRLHGIATGEKECQVIEGGLPDPVPEEELVEDDPLEEVLPFEEPEEKDEPKGPALGIGGGVTPVPPGVRGRSGRRPYAESARERRAVNDALRWLAAHQAPNGSWEAAGFARWCDGQPVAAGPDGPGKEIYDVGTTGLALLAFLGAGQTQLGKHPHAKTVAKGLVYLRGVQDLEGCFGPRRTQRYIYNHAIAALALVEAYGMTGSQLLESSAQRGLDFLAKARNPYFAWRYGVRSGDNDTSVTGWALSVVHAAKTVNEDAVRRGEAAPFVLDEEAFHGVAAWLERMTAPGYGRTGYIQRGGAPARPQGLIDRFPGDKSESMTSVGILLRFMLESDSGQSEIIEMGTKLVLHTVPRWNTADGSIDMLAWFYGSLAMHQVGGRPWETWQRALRKALLANQRKDGGACGYAGSWDPVGPWGPDGGRVYATALMTLCLETPYRANRLAR